MGSLIDDLALRAGVHVLERGGLRLVSYADLLTLLNTCRLAGVRVLGIEGFRVAGAVVAPDMEVILDLTDVFDPPGSVTEAERFLEKVADRELMFDVTVAG